MWTAGTLAGRGTKRARRWRWRRPSIITIIAAMISLISIFAGSSSSSSFFFVFVLFCISFVSYFFVIFCTMYEFVLLRLAFEDSKLKQTNKVTNSTIFGSTKNWTMRLCTHCCTVASRLPSYRQRVQIFLAFVVVVVVEHTTLSWLCCVVKLL